MHFVEPGTQTSSRQMLPLQNRFAGQSTSVVQAMLTHSAPPPAVGLHSSVAPHWSVAQSLLTQPAEPPSASQCWSGGQGNPTHGSAWPPVPLVELVVRRLPPLPDSVSSSFLPSGEYDGAPLMPARAETMDFFPVRRCCTKMADVRRSNETYASHSPSGDQAGDMMGNGDARMRTRLAPSESATYNS